MKSSTSIFLALSLLIVFSACKKGDTGPAGPAGPAGPTGPTGPQGIVGNANVVQYTFAGSNFATTSTRTLIVPCSLDSSNRSAWFVYLVRSSGNVYPLPGFGVNGTSDYRVYWFPQPTTTSFTITRVAGAGEEYSSIKVVRVYANSAVPLSAGQKADQVDYSDYHAVCKYYNLPF